MNDLKYVELYAQKLKEDHRLFSQHKKFIEAQLSGSHSLFKGMFAEDFKRGARNYLKKIRLL